MYKTVEKTIKDMYGKLSLYKNVYITDNIIVVYKNDTIIGVFISE